MMAAPHFSERDVIDQFRKAMQAGGVETSDDIEPTGGELKRVHISGDKPKTRNGWYVLFVDGVPSGAFGCFKRGIKSSWCIGTGGKPATPEEMRESQARLEAAQKARDAAERKRQGEAAATANLLLQGAERAGDDHPYLERKGVRAHGLFVGRWTKTDDEGLTWLNVPNALLVPIADIKGRIINLQAIFPSKHPKLDRDKDFLKGGKKRGGFHMIGTVKQGQAVIIAEGYATGATIHEATGWCVAVAFDAGNLRAVAEALAELMPGHPFVIAADNDRWTVPENGIANPGVHYATDAGRVINCRVVVPQFKSLDGEPTDFNDLAAREGMGEVIRQIIPALPVAANDNTSGDEGGELIVNVDRFNLPDQGGKGAVLPTTNNLREICRRLGVIIRYNAITKSEEILIPHSRYSVDNNARATLNWLRNECVLFRMATESLRGNILLMAEENHFNPVVTWVTSRNWDGVDRLRAMYDTVTPADPGKAWLRDALMKRWFVTAIAGAFNPDGVAAQGALVLQGPQNIGKTKWLMSLVPRHLRLAKEGVTLNPGDRDSVKQAVQFWLVELGELDATFRKSDIAQLKSFITKESDIFRKAYAEDDNHFARRTVFFGSVNPKHFLHDPTGNRRFWTIEASDVDHQHGIDMQQVWAQVHEQLYMKGEQIWLTDEENEALSKSNEEFQVIDPVEERLQTRLEWGAEPDYWAWRTATDVLMAIGMDRPTQSDCTKAAGILRKLNGGQGKRSNGKSLLLVPPAVRYADFQGKP